MNQFEDVRHFLASWVTRSWKSFPSASWTAQRFSPWNAQLAARFGLLDIRAARPGSEDRDWAKGWGLGAARRTPWGDTVSELIDRFVEVQEEQSDDQPDHDDDSLSPAEELSFGYLQPAFQPFFPDWKRVFAVPKPPPRSGMHMYKVSLGGWRRGTTGWHRIAVAGTDSLHDFVDHILKAFNVWDDDHGYVFSFRDQSGKGYKCYHPDMDGQGDPYATEMLLEDMNMPDGRVMKFLFDFGDRWEFDLLLERVVPYGE